jgi:hypothetical protein
LLLVNVTASAGWTLIIVGNGVGFLFAVMVPTISVVSFPLLLDRDLGAAVAVLTSARVVRANPAAMGVWGFTVALVAIGSIAFVFGLAVVMPMLGHATWHLYRKAAEPNLSPPQELSPPSIKRTSGRAEAHSGRIWHHHSIQAEPLDFFPPSTYPVDLPQSGFGQVLPLLRSRPLTMNTLPHALQVKAALLPSQSLS